MGDSQQDRRTEAGQLTHLDEAGAARMVDVGDKPATRRTACARAVCSMKAETGVAIRNVDTKKGDVLPVARLAAIGAAKRTDELIPLCHGIPIESVDVAFQWLSDTELEIQVTSACTGKTGVEMEAMVGASVAALTVYDMCKAMDRDMQIGSVELLAKTGGSRGDYYRNKNS